MLVSNVSRNSELYNTLAEMGLLCTEDYRIRTAHEVVADSRSKLCDLSYKDVERVGYLYPHFMCDIGDKGKFEVWIGDEYINPAEIQWIEGLVHLYGILPRHYDEKTQKARLVYLNDIAKRYSNVEDVVGEYTHTERINLLDYPYRTMANPEKSVYCIVDGVITTPEVTRIGDQIIEFKCDYTKSIDFIISSSLVGIYRLKAGVGTNIDNPYSNRCYLSLLVDHDPAYQLHTKFYPCVMADMDCTLRVFAERSAYVPHPEISRLMLYPEFIDVADPYNTDNEYLNNLPELNQVIKSTDSEETILEKFSDIAAYCYRAWEKFPFFCNEQSDFLMCDNTIFGKPTFHPMTVYPISGKPRSAIVSTVPYEEHRDIVFYDGHIVSDYEVIKLNSTHNEAAYEELTIGIPLYVLPDTYDPDKLTVVKFNAAEDTAIINIGEYIDADNLARLHLKLNRFYRNLLILRGKVMDFDKDDTYVRVSTVPPSVKDEYLWFELLVNAVPEVFNDKSFELIKSFGLDPYNLPEDIKEGMYTLGLDTDAGPEEYTDLLFTYFKLGKAQKKYLVIQYGDGVDDPRIQVYHDMMHGKLPDDPSLNATVIENPQLDSTESFSEYEAVKGPPSVYGKEVGAISVSTGDTDPDDIIGNEFDDILDGVTVEEVDTDSFALDSISYMDMETGKSIDGATIAGFTVDQKRAIITRYITDGTEDDRATVLALWNGYLDNMDEDTLNMAVYKVLLTDYAYTTALEIREPESNLTPMKDVKYILSEDTPIDADIGMYWLDVPGDAGLPVVSEAKKHNLTYIYSAYEPPIEEIGDIWINVAGVTLQDYIDDIIANPLSESIYYLPEGFFNGERASVTFDYGAHGSKTEPELFRSAEDHSLHKVHFGNEFVEEPVDGDVWFEFLDEIDNRVCYSDTEAMVLNINERLIYVQFDHDNITAFAFDDIVLNFHGKLGVRYLSILADLVNSGTIKQEDMNIFYKRLVTGPDYFEPGLERLYTGRSHVISTAKVDTTDYTITYSTNIGRLHIDYVDGDVTNRERESAYRMVIDYSRRDIAFLTDRMMLFVNGRYVQRTEYEEIAAGKIQLIDFKEIINCVDIFYSVKDIYLSRAKKLCLQYWGVPDTSVSIQRPDVNYSKMVPIHVCKHTRRGYYDVLLDEFVLNGRLGRTLRYLKEHPEETPAWRADFIRKFHAITDTDVVGFTDDKSRIIIPCFGSGETPPYTIANQ